MTTYHGHITKHEGPQNEAFIDIDILQVMKLILYGEYAMFNLMLGLQAAISEGD